MVKKTIIATILIAILLTASAYVVYNQYYNSSSSKSPTDSASTGNPSSSGNNPTNSPTNSNKSTSSSSSSSSAKNSTSTSNTIIDGAGFIVNVPESLKRIVVLDGNLAEMLCYMGLQNSIVGRTDAQCPPQLLNVKSVGEAAYALNVEVLIELEPDIIIADSLLTYDMGGAYTKLKAAGIPIYISQPPTLAQNTLNMTPEELYNSPTNIDIVCSVMQDLSTVVGNKDRVDAFVTWAQSYNKLVKDIVATLPREQKNLAYVHWPYDGYRTINDLKIYQAGGINVAETTVLVNPLLSAEWLAEQNPSVIIVLVSSPSHSLKDFEDAINTVKSTPVLQTCDAVKNGRVYACDFTALNGMRSIIGYLYYATWISPEHFADVVDPAAVAKELNEKYLGTSTSDVYCYPR
ncbi:MAG: ABC transporter substrate-binding protein [Candidatus Bathyarchaeota archaeon]|uniref:ABC transporter substrate-binding protein n=1 Tax=Candidatus Bathycorpusculum sp. TaxID=2994959 RepID=UPI002830FFF9|nr:ABC transporter substrate-binding protein [Candidatus Termiticorpusculum sp.]MCL2257036.1 ABC transporter substrate-binding protein [Candidatus Termiticorpusculum sp.]MCL2292838.1 ABC transporter substrate-binding protein [Candidatus Termiticorpusculum sp.]